MNERKISLSNLSLLALAAVAAVPFVACSPAATTPPQTAQQQPYPPPGYPPQQQGYPQQYPQQPPPGYPPQPQAQYPQQPMPQQPGFPAQPQQPVPQQPGAPAAPGSAAPSPIPGIPIDPNLLGQLMGGAGTTPAPAGQGGITDLAGAAVKIAQLQYAPSPMQPDGNMSEDTLQAGQRKDVTLTLTGGKCYTIIGASPLGQIQNLNVTLLAPPFYNMNAGTDNMSGNTAVVGGGNSPICPITPFPLQYKAAVTAVAGQGTFAVQLYSKNK